MRVHWFLRLWLSLGVVLSLLFAAVGAALWLLFRREPSSLEPLSSSSSLSSVAQSLLAAEAVVAGEAVEPESSS